MKLRQAQKARDKKRGPVKYPRISSDAKALGVSRGHLWQVLEGRRLSKPLLKRFRLLAQPEVRQHKPMVPNERQSTKPPN